MDYCVRSRSTPAEVVQKIAALKKLETSGDPVLAEEARAAEEHLHAENPH
jgi:hypothetical protein